jgi:hypothetical protein
MKKLSLLFVAASLCGCATGSWSERWMAMPSAAPNESFIVDGLPEYGQLSFENKAVSLFLNQCHVDPQFPHAVPGQLCGTLILSPGATVEFMSDEFRMTDMGTHVVRTMKIQNRNFDIGVPYLGPDIPGSSRPWPVKPQKLYALPGKRFKFMILSEPMEGTFELRLASVKVNSNVLEFPVLRLVCGPGRVWTPTPV